MKVIVAQGSIEAYEADTLIVNLFDDVKTPHGATGAVDKALDGAISELIANGDLTGKTGEVRVIYPHGKLPAKRVLVVGLGQRDSFDIEGVRRAAGTAVAHAQKIKAKNVATIVHGAGVAGLPAVEAAQATAEGALLALYKYQSHAKKQEETSLIETLTLVEFDESKLSDIETGVAQAEAIVAGVTIARNLVNMPPNIATPTRMAETAETIAADHNLNIIVGDREWAAAHNMGAFLAVAQGAGEPPKFIVMEHNANREDLDTVILVGKGVTFDTGGISIKPAQRMEAMKSDMGGAAAVIGAMKVVGALDLPLRVIGIAPCTENMPDANAYRPADVITAGDGTTIEIISTDAEGRMALADSLIYAQRYKPDAVVDLATLTGSSVIALGAGVAAAIFSNDDALRDQLIAAGKTTHERLWPLPLWDDYRKSMKSNVADLKNAGGRFGGVGTSAIFLKTFTDYSWAHLDIASMALSEKGSAYVPAGGTGFGVRLLVSFLLSRLDTQ